MIQIGYLATPQDDALLIRQLEGPEQRVIVALKRSISKRYSSLPSFSPSSSSRTRPPLERSDVLDIGLRKQKAAHSIVTWNDTGALGEVTESLSLADAEQLRRLMNAKNFGRAQTTFAH